jgi:fructose-1,6-bisphosphatase II / sedoheptulose-1,7-bisphosphatase
MLQNSKIVPIPTVKKLPKYFQMVEKQILNVVEKAAIESYKWRGRGDSMSADDAAVRAMRTAFNDCNFKCTVTIGEGERDESPMLYIGEKLGDLASNLEFDLAVDPLEGTDLCAHNKPNSICILALSDKDSLLNAPDLYMEKLVAGIQVPEDLLSLRLPITENIRRYAQFANIELSEVTICMLERPRHESAIGGARAIGARVKLIPDSDILAAIETTKPFFKHHLYYGIGGAPEGVIAAAAIKNLGGFFEGKLVFRDTRDKEHASKKGIVDFSKIYSLTDLAKANTLVAFSAVTDNSILAGITFDGNAYQVNSLIIHPGGKFEVTHNKISAKP